MGRSNLPHRAPATAPHGPHHTCSSSSWLGARGPLLAIGTVSLDGGSSTVLSSTFTRLFTLFTREACLGRERARRASAEPITGHPDATPRCMPAHWWPAACPGRPKSRRSRMFSVTLPDRSALEAPTYGRPWIGAWICLSMRPSPIARVVRANDRPIAVSAEMHAISQRDLEGGARFGQVLLAAGGKFQALADVNRFYRQHYR